MGAGGVRTPRIGTVKWGIRRMVLAAGTLGLGVCLGLGAAVVHRLERGERNVAAAWQNAGSETALVDAELEAHQRVVFEVCATDGLGPAWDGASFEVVHLPDAEVAARIPVDARLRERITRNADAGCAVVAEAGALGGSGRFAVRVVGAEASLVARGRIMAWSPVPQLGRLAVWGALGCTGLLLLGMLLPAPPRPTHAIEDEAAGSVAAGISQTAGKSAQAVTPPARIVRSLPRPLVRVAGGILGFFGVMLLLAIVPLSGPAFGVARGTLIALAEVALALALTRGRSTMLALRAPPRPWLVLALAIPLGGLLWLAGRMLAGLVPASGESPIEAFVAFPSGSLAVALVAVFVPLAEEIFFRGFVYGALAPKSRMLAFALTAGLFALAHLPQQWGAWGGFASVALTGVVLTGIRAATGSTVASAFVHVTHNAIITALAVLLR